MDFWAEHGTWNGIAVLLGFACFPRLMLLFVVTTPFDPMAWVVWAVSPSLVVAYLASVGYWDTNPFLVLAAWAIAIPKAIIAKEWASEKLFGPRLPPLPTCPRHTTYRGKGPAPDCATCLDILAEVQRRAEEAQRRARDEAERQKPKPIPPPAECPVHGRNDGDRPPATDCAVCHANYATWKRAKWKAKWAARWKAATS